MQKPKLNRAFFVAAGKRGGIKGGPARAVAIGPRRCQEIAKAAAAARWKGHIKAVKA